jgi:imidazolonepropionase-like amidohydrolase
MRHTSEALSDATMLTGAGQLLTLRGGAFRRGAELRRIGLVKNGAVLWRDGLILAVGRRSKVEAHPLARGAAALDVGGRVVLPGFVDSHTHLVHAASRAQEYELRIQGASYEEIAKRGGGILNSVAKLRAADSQGLKRRALGKSSTVATLLPGCDFHLGLKEYAPARELIEAGAIVGLATDYNPGTSPTMSMPMMLSLACTQLRMTPAEAIAAATINAAYSLKRHKKVGSLETGKQADLAVFEVEDYREIPYYFGMNFCHTTIKRGEVIYSRSTAGAA